MQRMILVSYVRKVPVLFLWDLREIKCFVDFLATGEPPLCMAVSVLFALRNAIDDARRDAGDEAWYRFGKTDILFAKIQKSYFLSV